MRYEIVQRRVIGSFDGRTYTRIRVVLVSSVLFPQFLLIFANPEQTR